jgi:hypothetical protein
VDPWNRLPLYPGDLDPYEKPSRFKKWLHVPVPYDFELPDVAYVERAPQFSNMDVATYLRWQDTQFEIASLSPEECERRWIIYHGVLAASFGLVILTFRWVVAGFGVARQT